MVAQHHNFERKTELRMAKKSIWGVSLAGAGMLALVAGQKKLGLGLFARGCLSLEKDWRAANPDFHGSIAERWEKSVTFYRATHQDRVNRWLHIAGIPMIVAGAGGLLALKPFRPAWVVAAGSFAFGWGLNIVGHAVFEKKAPAFRDDPLSFIAGPVWDFQQMFSKERAASAVVSAPAPASAASDDVSGEAQAAPVETPVYA
jgi:hypothetical protein